MGADARTIKRAAERRTYSIDFKYQPELTAGQTLSSVDSYSATSGITIHAAAVSGTTATLDVSGGTADSVYELTVTVNLSGGGKLTGRLDVVVQ